MEDISPVHTRSRFKRFIKRFFTRKNIILTSITILVCVGIFSFYFYAKENKASVGLKAFSAFSSVSKFLPISPDRQKEIEAMNGLVSVLTKSDDRERKFLILLQNNMELRPGGGFLGQYAVVTLKNGEVTSTTFEDANLLDQRIYARVTPPYPLRRMMSIKRWKFRDSNFSPDFPTNVEKAKYFMGLAGRPNQYDGVIAVNAEVFNDLLGLTGPLTVPGYSHTFTSTDGALKLEEVVEKAYIMNPEIDTQNRKMIMKKMAPLLIEKLMNLRNIPKIAELVHTEFKKKNIMVNFSDPYLQSLVEGVHWDGRVAQDWGSDYFMMVDANMGSLKTDYYMKREISYDIDLTAEKPVVTVHLLYKNTAPYANWRTSDYHSYLRIYVPKGSNMLERKMVNNIATGEEFGKTYIGFILHATIGDETDAMIKYELPADFKRDDYRLLIQKQSGVGEVPVKVHVKNAKGEFNQEQLMTEDLKFEFKEEK